MGTSSQTDRPSHVDRAAVVGLDERAAAGGHDDVAQRQQDPEDLALDRAEVRLAELREDLRDRPPLARFDQLVDVLGPPAEPLGQRARDGRLAGRHEPDEVDLVRRHRVSRSSASKKPGYETSTEEAPRIVVGAGRAGWRRARTPSPAGDRPPRRLCRPAAAARSRRKPSGNSSTYAPSARNPAREAGDAVALLDAQLARAAHAHLARRAGASRPARRAPGISSMSPGTSSGAISKLAAFRTTTRMRPTGSPASSFVRLDVDFRAGAARDVEDGRPGRVEADALDLDLRARDVPAASAIQNAALEISPGTASRGARSRCPPSIADRCRRSVETSTPNACSARSV